MWHDIERGVDDSSPIRTAAVLTCVAEPQPADAFRPAFCDRRQKIYLSRNLKRELLAQGGRGQGHAVPGAVRALHAAALGGHRFLRLRGTGGEHAAVRAGLRPRGGHLRLAAVYRSEARAKGAAAGELRAGGHRPGGHDPRGPSRLGRGFGGHGSGRKLPIVFAGLLLDDPVLANINKSFPKASFGEDEQTAYGDCWTGAKVVFAGHSGIDAATGAARSRGNNWGPYEHTPPAAVGTGPEHQRVLSPLLHERRPGWPRPWPCG